MAVEYYLWPTTTTAADAAATSFAWHLPLERQALNHLHQSMPVDNALADSFFKVISQQGDNITDYYVEVKFLLVRLFLILQTVGGRKASNK